jgi:hypothetical protein
MSYYKHKNSEQAGISVGRALLAVLMIAVLVGGFAARDTLRALFFEPKQDMDIAGEWLGIITEDYDAEIRYEYRLVFTQAEDGTLTGQMRVQSTNRTEDILAYSNVAGIVDHDEVAFHETRVTYLDGVSNYNWCMIEVNLDYEVVNGQETMTGSWVGIDTPGVVSCAGIDGRVILTREQ